MIDNFLNWLPTFLDNQILIGLLFFVGTAVLIALWVPGFLLPIAASSGALLDAYWGTAAVTGGALVGSMAIFATARHFGTDRVPTRVALFLKRFEPRFRSQGAWFVLVLRLVGAPHFVISAGSALMPIRASRFAWATLAGMIPAILLAAVAGSSVA